MATRTRTVSFTLAVENADRALAALRGFGKQGEAELAKIAASASSAAPALKRTGDQFAATSTTVVAGSRQMRGALGQVGLQMQDVIVQLQAGTNPLTVFVQQGTQIAGAFGPAGAIIGVVGAAVAIAAGAFLSFGRDVDTAKAATDAFRTAQDHARETIGASALSVDDLRARYDELSESMRRIAEIDLGAALRENAKSLSAFREQAFAATPDVAFLQTAITAAERTGARPTDAGAVEAYSRLYEGVTKATAALRDGGAISDFVVALDNLAQSSPQAETFLRQTIDQLAEVARSAADLEETGKRLQAELAVLRQEPVPGDTLPPPAGGGRGGGSGDQRQKDRDAQAQAELDSILASWRQQQDVERKLYEDGRQAKRQRAEEEARERKRLADQAAAEAKRQAEQRKRDQDAQAQAELDSILTAWRSQQDLEKKLYEDERREKQRQAEEAAREAQQQQEREAELALEPMRNAVREIQGFIAESFTSAFQGTVTSAEDAADRILAIFQNMAGQMAAAELFKPGGFLDPKNLGSGSLGSLAPGLFGGTGAADVTFGQLALAGGLGATAGGVVASATGGNALGSSIGGGVGAAGGYILGNILFPGVGGIPGAALGSLAGSLIGGLFGGGGGGERNNNFQYDIDLATGRTSGSNTKPDQANVDIVTQLTGRVQGLIEALQDLGGTTTGSINIQSGNRSGLTLDGVRYSNPEELQLDAFRQIVAATSGLDPLVATAAAKSQATDAEQFIADLQFAQAFDQLTGKLSTAAQAAEDFGKAAQEARDKAEELGLSVADLVAAQEKQAKAMLDQAADSAASAVAATRSAFDSLISPLAGFRQSIAMGAASPLSGRQQLGLARRSFDEAVRDANQGGTTADEVANVTRLAQQVLDASRAVNGSSSAYFDDFRAINQMVLGLQRQLEQQKDSFERSIPAEIRAAADRQVDLLSQNVAESKRLVVEFRELKAEMGDVMRRLARA